MRERERERERERGGRKKLTFIFHITAMRAAKGFQSTITRRS